MLTLLMSSICIVSNLVLGRNDFEIETAAVLVSRRTYDVTISRLTKLQRVMETTM